MKTLLTLVIGATSAVCATAFVQAQSNNGTTQGTPAVAAAPAASARPVRAAVRQQRRQTQAEQRRRFPRGADGAVQPQPRPRQHPRQAAVSQQQLPAQQPAGRSADSNKMRRQQKHRAQRNESHRPAVNFTEAVQRQCNQRHDRGWWHRRYTTIVFVNNCGYFYWDAGYWFPAWGYYPQFENFDYNGPIYTYGNLLPDQVIYNVQQALKELGYYSGPLSGSMSGATRSALSAFQEDNGLDITGAIDAPTVEALGLY